MFSVDSADTEPARYERVLDKQETRVFCLSFHPTGQFICSGTVDEIRTYCVETGFLVMVEADACTRSLLEGSSLVSFPCEGRCLLRMLPGRLGANTPTIVWKVSFLSDFTVVSGDSRGKTCFWDGKTTGSLRSAFQSHASAVLSVAPGGGEDGVVYAAGVDPTVQLFYPCAEEEEKPNGKWVRALKRNLHSHDVRSLLCFDNWLVSGGVDGYIALSAYPPKTLLRIPSLPAHVSLARMISSTDPHHHLLAMLSTKEPEKKTTNKTVLNLLDLYRIPKASLGVKSEPHKLLTIQAKKGILDWALVACESYTLVVYVTQSTWRAVTHANGQISPLVKHDSLPKQFRWIRTVPGKKLFVALSDEVQLHLLDYDQESIWSRGCVDVPSLLKIRQRKDDANVQPPVVHDWSVSSSMLAVSHSFGMITLFSISTESKESPPFHVRYHIESLSRKPAAISVDDKALCIVTADARFTEYDASTGRRRGTVDLAFCKEARSVLPTRIVPVGGSEYYLYDTSTILRLRPAPAQDDKSILSLPVPAKRTRSQSESERESRVVDATDNQQITWNVSMCTKYKYVAMFDSLNQTGDEVVVVEVSPERMMEKLPPVLKIKKFGTG